MNIRATTLLIFFAVLFAGHGAFAGNPDRQGEAGAYELLLSPWARVIGLSGMNTAGIQGIDAMSLNIAGLSRMTGDMEVGVAHSIYLVGTGLGVNGLGFATRVGKFGTLGIGLNAMDFGQIPVTMENLPEGTGATYSPRFYNLGLSYATTFEEKVSVGFTVRLISESIAQVGASGFSLDAGIQYVNGPKDYPQQFKFGVALRNIGSNMVFGGQGLNHALTNPNTNVTLTYAANGAGFELPSQLYIGASYDLIPVERNKLTFVGNFTSNAFSRDDIGGGLEFSLGGRFMLRAGYKYEIGSTTDATGESTKSVYTGICAGLSVRVPFNKENKSSLTIDYGYLASNPWGGTHNLSVKMGF